MLPCPARLSFFLSSAEEATSKHFQKLQKLYHDGSTLSREELARGQVVVALLREIIDIHKHKAGGGGAGAGGAPSAGGKKAQGSSPSGGGGSGAGGGGDSSSPSGGGGMKRNSSSLGDMASLGMGGVASSSGEHPYEPGTLVAARGKGKGQTQWILGTVSGACCRGPGLAQTEQVDE